MNVRVKKIIFEYWLSAAVLLLLLILVIKPLLHDGFFPTFDDVQVVRVDEMSKELRSGQFPVRFVNDLGNGGGYNLFSFYPPFVYYLGSLIHILGFSLVKTVKLLFILGYFVAGSGMFILLRNYFPKSLATIGTALLLSSPFFNYEVFIRGALAEFFGMSLFPLTLWLLIRLIEERRFSRFILFGSSFAIMILSHTFVGIFAAFFFVGLILLQAKKQKSLVSPFLGILLGIFLAAWFWLPVLLQQSFTQYSQSFFATQSFSTNFLSIAAIFGIKSPAWDFLPPLLGLVLSTGAILGLGLGVLKKTYKGSPLFIFSSLGFVACIFLATNASNLIWQASAQLQYMQFPWRFLVFMTFFSVVLSVFLLSNIKNVVLQAIVGALFVVGSIFLYKSYLNPSTFNYISQYFAEDICGTTTWAQEYLPKDVKKCLPRSKQHEFIYPKVIIGEGMKVESGENHHGREIVINSSDKGGVVVVRKYYSPGWQAVFDGNTRLNITPTKPFGLVSFVVPSGNHKVELVLQKTQVEKFSEYLTIIGVILTITSFLWTRTHIIKKKK